jgi:ABC-2 type transporter.
MALWNMLFATVETALSIGMGILFFNVQFSAANILSASVIIILTIISFSSLGILSASFMIIFKRGNPVGWVLNTLTGLFGGVYFPVSVMPEFLQVIARFFPVTYAIRALQLAVYRGYSLSQLTAECGILLMFCLVLVPLSLAAFNYALTQNRRNGSLLQY